MDSFTPTSVELFVAGDVVFCQDRPYGRVVWTGVVRNVCDSADGVPLLRAVDTTTGAAVCGPAPNCGLIQAAAEARERSGLSGFLPGDRVVCGRGRGAFSGGRVPVSYVEPSQPAVLQRDVEAGLEGRITVIHLPRAPGESPQLEINFIPTAVASLAPTVQAAWTVLPAPCCSLAPPLRSGLKRALEA